MSKVVHLSNDAHAAAKAYCKENGLKMSDWVASLITKAICIVQEPEPEPAPAPIQPAVSAQPMSIAAAVAQHQAAQVPAEEVPPGMRKKRLARYEDEPTTEDGIPDYARPPFWARSAVEESPESINENSDNPADGVEATIPATIPNLSELDL